MYIYICSKSSTALLWVAMVVQIKTDAVVNVLQPNHVFKQMSSKKESRYSSHKATNHRHMAMFCSREFGGQREALIGPLMAAAVVLNPKQIQKPQTEKKQKTKHRQSKDQLCFFFLTTNRDRRMSCVCRHKEPRQRVAIRLRVVCFSPKTKKRREVDDV